MPQLPSLSVLSLARITIAALLLGLTAAAQDKPATKPPGEVVADLRLLDPPWRSSVAYRESTTPLRETDASPILGRLAFEAASIDKVTSADGARTYEIGKDVTLQPDGKTLEFTAESGVPFLRYDEFYPEPQSPRSYRHRKDHPEQWMLYSEGHWFHDRQIEVTYTRKTPGWPGTAPALAKDRLPRTLAKLAAGEPLTIGVSGDSITAGANASGQTGAAPHMPAYPALVAAQLEATAKSPVTLRNRAVGGWSVANGVGDIETLMNEKPDLLIVAYGMNDVGRRDPKWFTDQTAALIAKARARNPEVEIILVASMLGNSEWVHTPREMFAQYRDALGSLTGPGIALADVTAVWDTMLKSKHDYDLIGNGLNHPNDFGHRLYAQTILSLLIAPAAADAK